MERFRRHHPRTRFSLLAIFVLLWSQLALASHPACTLSSMMFEQAHPVVEAPCHVTGGAAAAADMADEPACESHCSRSDLSPDTARVLAVPALAPQPAAPAIAVQCLAEVNYVGPSPAPLGAWHRPTLHPASLLLI
ncbi:hypothetical protein [Arenimonas alkanexedens]